MLFLVDGVVMAFWEELEDGAPWLSTGGPASPTLQRAFIFKVEQSWHLPGNIENPELPGSYGCGDARTPSSLVLPYPSQDDSFPIYFSNCVTSPPLSSGY